MLEKKSIDGAIQQVATGIRHLQIIFVNSYFVETPKYAPGSWVLVDTGIPLSATRIINHAEKLYGADSKPSAIVLTHGHFDHAGSALKLAAYWDVPIYAHHLEMPYLTGKSDYPPQDPTVGGALAQMSRLFPHSGFNFGTRVYPLPLDGSIAEMPGWQAIHTPGHTAGHISLFRECDRTLLAGDALATMNQDSWISNVTEEREFHEPAAPFTSDWIAARRSVEILAELEPQTVAAGHGLPISGADTAARLIQLALNFAPPEKGRYVNEPAIADETGVVYVPPPVPDPVRQIMIGAAVGISAGLLLNFFRNGKDDKRN